MYKPQYYYFDIINFFHKMILWATLVFFGYGSQLQVGTALLLCVARLVIHNRFEPYRERTDNLFDEVVLMLTALLGLGGLMLQYLETVKDFAVSKNDRLKTTTALSSIHGVEVALNISVFAVMAAFVCFLLHIVAGDLISRSWLACRRRCSDKCASKRSRLARLVRETERQNEHASGGADEQAGATRRANSRTAHVASSNVSVEMHPIRAGGGVRVSNAAPVQTHLPSEAGLEGDQGDLRRKASTAMANLIGAGGAATAGATTMVRNPSFRRQSLSARGEFELEGVGTEGERVADMSSNAVVGATAGESKGCNDGIEARNKEFFQHRRKEKESANTKAAHEKIAARSQLSPEARQAVEEAENAAEEHGRAKDHMIREQMGTFKAGGGQGKGRGGGRGRGRSRVGGVR